MRGERNPAWREQERWKARGNFVRVYQRWGLQAGLLGAFCGWTGRWASSMERRQEVAIQWVFENVGLVRVL